MSKVNEEEYQELLGRLSKMIMSFRDIEEFMRSLGRIFEEKNELKEIIDSMNKYSTGLEANVEIASFFLKIITSIKLISDKDKDFGTKLENDLEKVIGTQIGAILIEISEKGADFTERNFPDLYKEILEESQIYFM